MSRQTLGRPAIWALALALGALGCGETAPPAPEHQDHPDISRAQLPEQYADDLLRLRRNLAKYESFDRAKADGFDTQLTGCMVMRPAGGMGFHYGNTAIIDAIPDPQAPEVLLYEPGKNGARRLVGVEFVFPFSEWTGSAPPVLYGEVMRPNNTFGLWTLHIGCSSTIRPGCLPIGIQR